MTNEEMLARAKKLVVDFYNANEERDPVAVDEVFIVWFCKTLQNWKALAATHRKDDLYFEITHNGDKDETYLDVYMKVGNIAVPIE